MHNSHMTSYLNNYQLSKITNLGTKNGPRRMEWVNICLQESINPLVPDAHHSEPRDKLVSLQIDSNTTIRSQFEGCFFSLEFNLNDDNLRRSMKGAVHLAKRQAVPAKKEAGRKIKIK